MNKTAKYVIIALLATDMLLIALHLFLGWDLVNLDQEANLPTWYSSAKLLMLALMSVLLWDAERKAGNGFRFTWLWLVVAMIFLGLSADETASMHERASRCIMKESDVGLDIRETVLGGDRNKDSFAWVLLLSPLIVAVALFFLVFFVKRLRLCRTAVLASVIGLGMFLLAIAMESTIYFFPSINDWTASNVRLYNGFIAIEESGELFGSTLILLAFFSYMQYVMEKKRISAGES